MGCKSRYGDTRTRWSALRKLDVCGRAFPVEIFQFTAQFTSLRFSPSDLLPIYYFDLLDAGFSGRPWL